MPSAQPQRWAFESIASNTTPSIRPAGNFRWVICTLLLIGVTKNYMDRQVLGVLKTTLQHDLGWNEIDYSNLVFAFQAAYAAGMALVGRLNRPTWDQSRICGLDDLLERGIHGSRRLRIATEFRSGAVGAWVRRIRRLPGEHKTVAEWFPQKERALATGIFNAGSNAGAILTPFVVPWITAAYGWRAAFIFTGALGFVWLILRLLLYRKPEEHPRVSRQELEWVNSRAAFSRTSLDCSRSSRERLIASKSVNTSSSGMRV